MNKLVKVRDKYNTVDFVAELTFEEARDIIQYLLLLKLAGESERSIIEALAVILDEYLIMERC